MIQPDTFYQPDDHPSKQSKIRMWSAIQRETGSRKGSVFAIADFRSFAYGIAAAALLYFASVGVYSTVRQSFENSKPQVVRLDEAYQSAIEDIEKFVPQVTYSNAITEPDKNYLEDRKDQLKKIDLAIEEFKHDIGSGDCSPRTQQRLRQLYSMKLSVLQELIDKGEKVL